MAITMTKEEWEKNEKFYRIIRKIAITGLLSPVLFFGGYGLFHFAAIRWPYHPPVPNAATEVIDAFPESELEGMRESVEGKKMALALIATYDYNGAFNYTEGNLELDFAAIPGYELFCQRVSSRDELFNALRDYSQIKGIDALILAFHGNNSCLSVAKGQDINVYNAYCFNSYSPLLAEDAVVLLHSCATGGGKSNVATKIADALNADVIAPKFPMENSVQLTVDESGRLNFDSDELVVFKKIRADCDEGDFIENHILQDSYCGCKDAVVDEEQSGQNAFLFVDK